MTPIDPQAVSAKLTAEGMFPTWLVVLLIVLILGYIVIRKINSLPDPPEEVHQNANEDSFYPSTRGTKLAEDAESLKAAQKKMADLFPNAR